MVKAADLRFSYRRFLLIIRSRGFEPHPCQFLLPFLFCITSSVLFLAFFSDSGRFYGVAVLFYFVLHWSILIEVG